MKYLHIIPAFLLFFSISATAQQKSGWQSLFGEKLEKASYNSPAWHLTEEGILTAAKDDAIWTKEEYEKFELDLEFMTDAGTNSGVIIYCTDTENWIPNSVEIQIADDHYEKWAESQPYERCGAIYGHLGPDRFPVVKEPGVWNHMRVRCNGQRIMVILNGKKVTNMDMSQWISGTHNPDSTEIPSWLPTPFAELPTKGYIGLQGKHGDATIYFKNVKIREIKAKEEKQKAAPEVIDGVVPGEEILVEENEVEVAGDVVAQDMDGNEDTAIERDENEGAVEEMEEIVPEETEASNEPEAVGEEQIEEIHEE